MPATDVVKISKIDGVESAAGGLTLNSLHIEGTVPEQQQHRASSAGRAPAAVALRETSTRPRSASPESTRRRRHSAPSPPDRSSRGTTSDRAPRAERSSTGSYASSNGLSVGDTVKLGGRSFTVIGIAETPLGGQSSDVYVKLSQLQQLSDRKGRVNTIYVRAESSDDVARSRPKSRARSMEPR
jgi:hypothetical protein